MEDVLPKTKDQNLGLFFTTQGKSLENWDKQGLLNREVKLYQNLASYFKKVYILTYGSKKDKEYISLFPDNVIIIPKPPFIPVFIYSFLLPIVKRGIIKKISIFKTNQMDGSWTAVISKKLYGGKLVVRCGYEWLNLIERSRRPKLKIIFARWAERFAYRYADKIIHTSNEAIEFTRKRFDVSAGKTVLIPNYIDTEFFAPQAVGERKGVIFVGRLEEEKNVDSLLKALTGINTTVTIVGDGSLRAKLSALAKENNISATFLGKISQASMPIEIAKHQIFILPSFYEGSPKALLEAMSCGIACVATNVSGNKEIVRDGENGLLCGTEVEAIHTVVGKLLLDTDLQARLSLQARKDIVENYSFGKILKEELSVYNTL